MSDPAAVPEPDSAQLAFEVVQLLVAMSGRLSQNFAARAAEFDLSAGEGKLLLNLGPGTALPMRALARKLRYDASNLTGLVDRLEERNAVERRTDQADRRVKTIAATKRGLELRERFWRRLSADSGPVNALTESELRQLRKLLTRAMDG